MALKVEALPREFVARQGKGNERVLSDPGQGMSPEEVRTHYAQVYPELASAGIEGPSVQDGKQVYVFTGSVGVKG
jgi:PRTRC genetic system protein C